MSSLFIFSIKGEKLEKGRMGRDGVEAKISNGVRTSCGKRSDETCERGHSGSYLNHKNYFLGVVTL